MSQRYVLEFVICVCNVCNVCNVSQWASAMFWNSQYLLCKLFITICISATQWFCFTKTNGTNLGIKLNPEWRGMYKIESYFWYERQQRLLVLFVPKINLRLLSALTVFRSKFDLSNMRGAGEHHIHFSFLMNLELHEEFQMHSNSKANPPIYPTYLNNTKYWTKSFKKCIFFNVRRISEDEWP